MYVVISCKKDLIEFDIVIQNGRDFLAHGPSWALDWIRKQINLVAYFMAKAPKFNADFFFSL